MSIDPHQGVRANIRRLGFGCATFGREINEQTSRTLLDAAFDADITLFDTAEAYGGGQTARAHPDGSIVASTEMHSSEKILGRWMADHPAKRARVVVQTKVTPPLTRQRLLDSVDASLQRLRVEQIDSFLLHAPDPKTPIAETLAALQVCQHAGKIHRVGCSNFDASQLDEALRASQSDGLPRLQSIQFNYNLAVQHLGDSLLPLINAHGLMSQSYSPLGAGFLTGKYTPAGSLPTGSRFDLVRGHADIYFNERSFRAVEQLRALSLKTHIPAEQLAIAWVLANRQIDIVLVGARRLTHLQSTIAAAQLSFEPEWRDALQNHHAT